MTKGDKQAIDSNEGAFELVKLGREDGSTVHSQPFGSCLLGCFKLPVNKYYVSGWAALK